MLYNEVMVKKLFIIACVVVISLSGVFAYSLYKKPVATPIRASESNVVPIRDCTFNEQELINLMNSVRTNKLSLDLYLDGIAQKRSSTMPYGLDNHVGMRALRDSGAFNEYLGTGENLASNHCPSTKQLFSQWENSPSHWEAINDERYDAVGIGFNGQSAVVIFGDVSISY